MFAKTGKILTNTANWVVRLVGGAILFVLTWYSFRFTQYMVPLQGHEFPVDSPDSMWQNLLAVIVVMAAVAAGMRLEGRLKDRVSKWIGRVAVTISMLWQGIWGYLWISAADRCPKGDQESVFKAASAFLEGEYHALGPSGYCEIYPHQLGLASLEELLFRILGEPSYYAIQFLFVLMIVGAVYCVYGMLKEFTKRLTVIVAGTLLAGSCTAPIFYTCWVYGEVPFVFFGLLAGWMLARYVKRETMGSLIGFVVAVTFAVLMRQNALILVVAFILVTVVKLMEKFDRKLLVTAVLAILVPCLCYSGIYKIYELRSGYAHAEGLPSNGFVYIGLMETKGRYGWDFSNSYAAYYNNGRNTDKAAEAFDLLIAERWEEMAAQPGYLPMFFKNKVLSQWNAPLYQSMYFNYVHEDVHNEEVTAFFDRLSTDLFDELLWQADRLQFVIYLGTFLYFALCVKKGSNPLKHLLAVTIIGGFLFSVVWEAKTRYVFPYYMMMFPLAMLGYEALIVLIMNKILRRNTSTKKK